MNHGFKEELWTDVVPIKQYDGKPPILGISYPKEYEQMMDIFRAVVSSGEISERVFDLTYTVIQSLSSNYNVWYIRRKCLLNLNKDYKEELVYLNSIIQGNEKVYQIWEHRRQIIDKQNAPDGEEQFLKLVFDVDNKNYHGWSYKIWLCQRFNLFEQDLKNVEYYIEEDIGNNSAWNYKYFLIKNILTKENLEQELEYTFNKIIQKPLNESAWNYLKGWFKAYEFKKIKSQNENKTFLEFQYKDFPQVQKFVQMETYASNRFAQAILIDIYLQSSNQGLIEATLNICSELEVNDNIRKKYWAWYKQNIIDDFEQVKLPI